MPWLQPGPPPQQASVRSSSHCVVHVWDSGPCSCAPGSQMSLLACDLVLPLLSPNDVPRGCQVSRMQYSAASQGGVPVLPTILGLLKLETCPHPTSSLTGKECACECMQQGMGPRLCPTFPQLRSCPVTLTTVRVAFFNSNFPPLLHPFTKGLGTTSCPFCEIFM